jgi:hypothetical protein
MNLDRARYGQYWRTGFFSQGWMNIGVVEKHLAITRFVLFRPTGLAFPDPRLAPWAASFRRFAAFNTFGAADQKTFTGRRKCTDAKPFTLGGFGE